MTQGPQYSTETIQRWGKFQVVINDTDYTYVGGAPTILKGWSLREPFSDSQATFEFPTIAPFDAEMYYPFKPFDNIEINQVDNDGKFIKNLFEGMITSVDDEFSESNSSITVQAIGALYQADYFIRTPVFNDYVFDIGSAVQFELNNRIEYYGLRLQKLDVHTYTNIGSRSRGSWNPLLTGWIQDLLSTAYTDGFFLKGEEACSLVAVEGVNGTGLWALGNYGTNLSFGPNIPYYGSASYLTYYTANLYQDFEMYMRDISPLPTNDGFYVVDRRGKVFAYGNAVHYGDVSKARIRCWAIEVTKSGKGYWLLSAEGGVYSFGDAVNYDVGWPVLGKEFGFDDAVIDMCRHPDGEGYWRLTRNGRVLADGSANYYGQRALSDRFYSAIQCTKSGNGYYLLDTYGRVWPFGDAVHYGNAASPYNWVVDMALSETGEGYALLADNGEIYYFGDFPNRGTANWSVWDQHGANIYQWTLRKDPERRLKFAIKDNWTVNWTVDCGQPGISHSLTQDYAWAPNVYYGEGVDKDNCRWRNSKYPNIHPDDAPVWPGWLISVHYNNQSDAVGRWQQGMKDRGWPITVDWNYGWDDNHVCMRLQEQAGLTVDGIVGPQTWAATFAPGENAGSLNGAYYAPLAENGYVEPFTYAANGAITGRNERQIKEWVRIEHYDNYGEKTSKEEATISAQAKMRKDVGENWTGTITFKTDPAEGHRFDIREGQNILYKGFKAHDVMFHIAEVKFNPDDLSVTCTVDTAFRDAMTLDAIWKRNADLNNSPSRADTRYMSSSRVVEDRIAVWDCENGSGIIPRMGLYQNLWQVVRIPAGEFGQIIQAYFKLDVAAEFAVAVFDRSIKPVDLVAHGDPTATGFWQNFPEDQGLVIAWGGEGQMAGYYPGRGGGTDPVTGVLKDNGSWNYWSTQPPWIWIAFYSTATTFVEGRLFPGQEGTGTIPDQVGIAEPTGVGV